MQNSERCGKIETNQGRLVCPGCGFLLARLQPDAQASGVVLYCRKCKKQGPVNIPKPEP